MSDAPRFVFALAQPTAASWLKRDIAQRHPGLRFAFSRPGLYTFKLNDPASTSDEFELGSVFARHWGFSLGTALNAEQIHALASTSELPWMAAGAKSRLRLFVSQRDEGEEGSSDTEAQPEAKSRSAGLRTQLLALDGALFESQITPAAGDWVLDVIVPADDAETVFVGYHRHSAHHGKVPGGVTRVSAPSNAPSRAYSKLKEALAWSELPLRAKQHAVEIGCAPGGAVLLLLEQGLHVTGIDPAEMAPVLAPQIDSGAFIHLKRSVGDVTQDELLKPAQWLLCDANLAPQTALRYVTRIAKLLRPHLQGIIFTIKLNDERVVTALPSLFDALARLSKHPAHKALRAIQLPSHRSELVAVVRL